MAFLPVDAFKVVAFTGFRAASVLRPARQQRAIREAVRLLRQRFARGEIDATAYELGVQLLGLEHLDG